MKSGVRIIGGKYRGKKISVVDVDGLRPTPNRIKETLFNWLRPKIAGARCLDAFAGSGSLGFEAYSQGASRVVMVESAKDAYLNLLREVKQWNKNNNAIVQNGSLVQPIEVIYGQAQEYMTKCQSNFDIVFLDPPFKQSDLLPCLELLTHSKNLLGRESVVYVESFQEIKVDERFWKIKKSKRAGQVYYSLLEKNLEHLHLVSEKNI